MRIRWRGLELPGRIRRDESVSNESYARFTIEPFEQGYGTTIGNSLRRVLLSSLEGSAITAVKIEGVAHEFALVDGIIEDVVDVILNIKGVVVNYDGEEPKTITVERTTAGVVKAGDIVTDASVTITNPEHVIATLSTDVPFRAEFTVETGRGYATAKENRTPEQEVGVISIDAVFSPILRVRYSTEDIRVGQRTNYDRLILEIWTDGSILPEDALVEAAMILRKHLNPIVMYQDMGDDMVDMPDLGEDAADATGDKSLDELLDRPVSTLSLSVRSGNCLEAGRIATLRQLVQYTEGDLNRLRSFGKTSLHEVQRELTQLGLHLGMLPKDPPIGGVMAAPSVGFTDMTPVSPPGVAGDTPIPPNDAASGPMAAFTMND